jgi:predicted transposase YdaD
MYVYLTNLHTLWKLKSSYKDGALDPIFGKRISRTYAVSLYMVFNVHFNVLKHYIYRFW